MGENTPVSISRVELIKSSEVPELLKKIRPAWQAKNLISRVYRLINIDPSSACQRLFNAAIHDLREKIIVAGVDIASEAANRYKLPPINKNEDLEEYPTSKLIELAYRIGLLTRPEWRRLSRCYEIRRDLEHEDDEYEATIEDCVYIFRTCIEVVLSKDPIQLIRVTDVKQIIEAPDPVTPDQVLLTDFQCAPKTRQVEILKFLMSHALNEKQSDIVRQNAFTFLSCFGPLTHNSVKLELATYFQEKLGRKKLDLLYGRVAYAMGVFPYLKKAQRADLFAQIFVQMQRVGWKWKGYSQHGALLRDFKEIGGLNYCPEIQRKKILKWLVQTYLGEPGGRTSWGNIREVFYSDTAAPLVREIIKDARSLIRDELRSLSKDKDISGQCGYPPIARRFEDLLDLVELEDED
ncbi:MAG: hypothetical protein D6681_02805 [Calditrichaeota bacterium]|nr:MAG: hypothetical protein D6681_02805 [Calditrichota bacterium]